MTTNEQTIINFYSALEDSNSKIVCESYHPDIVFIDPVFGRLSGNNVCKMWKMLLFASNGNLKIKLSDVKADEYLGSAVWKATYTFGKKKRTVINVIHAEFRFQDGLIIKHTDDFDIWKWAKQALGIKGILLGWTGYMHRKIQENALSSLNKFKG